MCQLKLTYNNHYVVCFSYHQKYIFFLVDNWYVAAKLLTNTDREGLVTPDSVLAEGGAGAEQGEITSGRGGRINMVYVLTGSSVSMNKWKLLAAISQVWPQVCQQTMKISLLPTSKEVRLFMIDLNSETLISNCLIQLLCELQVSDWNLLAAVESWTLQMQKSCSNNYLFFLNK